MRCLALVAVVALAVPGAALAWTWPADGPVLRPFLFDRSQPQLPGQHRGIDVAGAAGATVVSPVDGVVTFAGTTPGNGLTLSIRTPDGYSVTLTHVGSLEVLRGTSVEEGAIVARVGASGQPEVDAPYVHLGIRLASDEDGYLDPLSFLPPRPAASPPAPPAPPAAVSAAGTDPPPVVAQAPAAAAPAEEQPVLVQAAPAPPSSSGSLGPPSVAPPSAQPNEPIEPEPAPAASEPTIATPDERAIHHPQPAHHVTRVHVEPRTVAAVTPAPRLRLQIESPPRARRAAAPTAVHSRVVTRTVVLRMSRARASVQATATRPVAREARSLPERHVSPRHVSRRGVPLAVALPLAALLLALAVLASPANSLAMGTYH